MYLQITNVGQTAKNNIIINRILLPGDLGTRELVPVLDADVHDQSRCSRRRTIMSELCNVLSYLRNIPDNNIIKPIQHCI